MAYDSFGAGKWIVSGTYAQRAVPSLQMVGGAMLSSSGGFSSIPVTGAYALANLIGPDGGAIQTSGAAARRAFLSASFRGNSGSIIQALNYLEARVTTAVGIDTLAELTDVSISAGTLADGNLLIYDKDADTKWENKVLSGDATINAAGALTLAGTNTNLQTLANVTTVGALDAGSITSGFGAIDNGTSNITTGGKLVIDVDGSAINAAGAITLGAGNDAAMYWDGGSLVLDTAAASDIAFEVAGTEVASLDADGLSLATGDAYQIDGTSVLNATTLGSNVVASSLTSVGTLTSGIWNAGAIDNGTNNITTGGKLVIDVDGSAINAAGAITLGAGNDAAMYWDGGSLVLDTAAASDIAFEVAGTEVASLDADGLSLATGDAYQIDGTSVLNATTLGSNVVASSLTSVGTISTGVWQGTDVGVAHGGTGASNAGDARTNLGLGSIATQDASSVAITGGTINGITQYSGSSVIALGVTVGGPGLHSLSGVDRPAFNLSGTVGRADGTKIEVGSTVSTGADYMNIDAIPHMQVMGTDASGKLQVFKVQVSGGLLQVESTA